MRLRKLSGFFLVIVLLLKSIFVFANSDPLDIHSLYFEVISTKNKLPNSVIRTIDQDSLGFLWFGSNDGLFRYDGQNFQVFRNIPNAPSLSFNYVIDVQLDHAGNPWALTYRSLDDLNSRSGKFRHFYPKPSPSGAIDLSTAYQFVVTPEDNIFITSTRHGLFFLPHNDSIIQYLSNDSTIQYLSKEKKEFPVLASDLEAITYHDHCLYVGKKYEGIFRIKLSEDNSRILDVRKIASSNQTETFTIYLDHRNRLWAGTSDGIILIDLQQGQSRVFHYSPGKNLFLPDKEVLSLYVDSADRLWIGTRENGLSIVPVSEIYEKGEKAVGVMYATSSKEGSLTNRCINKIFRDQNGDIWLGTYSGGLLLAKEYKTKIHMLKYIPGHPDSPSHPKIWGITQAKDGNIWLGTDGGGIDVWNPQQGIIKRLKSGVGGSGLSDNAILCAMTDSNGNLWFGTYRGGVNRIDPKTGKIRVYQKVPSAVPGDYVSDIRCIYQDTKGKIWIGTNWKGVCYYDQKADSFVNVQELGNIDVRAIKEASTGGYWIGTQSNGLIWFNPNTHEKKNFVADQKDPNSLPSNDIFCLKEDFYGKLWIGTQYGGLSCMNIKNGNFENFGQKNGLNNNTILGMLEDSKGYFWLSTNEGISRFDPNTKRFINYDQTNGVLPGEFLNGSCLAAADGTFYFGGSHGMNYFKPDFIQPSKVAPKVVFTHLNIFNRQVTPGTGVIDMNLEFDPKIRLTYQQSVFTIDFQAIQYPFAEKCQYEYMLEGYDEKWNHGGTNNSATYRQLPPGNYIFKVKASNSDGIWSQETASIPIEVIPPFWKTVWAYLLYIVVAAALIYTFFRFRMKQVRMLSQLHFEQEIRQKEQKIHHERLEFFTNISHELRTPLTLVECAVDDLKKLLGRTRNEKVSESLKTVGYHSSRLLVLINQLLEFRRIETGNPRIAVEKINLNQWMAEYLSNFKELADSKSISLKLSMPVKSVELWADPDKLSMILNNLLSNAFKFTSQKGSIEVNTEETDKNIKIEVSDSGSGISPKALPHIFDRYFKTGNNSTSTGIGLSLTKSLIELHHGTVDVSSTLGKGTKFTITLPMGNQHFKTEQFKAPTVKSEQISPPQEEKQIIATDKIQDSKIMLIIEDNPDISTLLADKFAPVFEVHVAEDGENGIELAQNLIPDIIISDIMMPGIQGTEVCKILKGNVSTSHIPIILLTAKGTIDDELVGLDTGADDYISKPFNFQILEARVRTLLQNRASLFNYFKDKTFVQSENKPENQLLEQEQEFLQKVESLVREKYLSPDTSVFNLAEDLNFSRSSLYRKIKMVTGLSINEFVRTIRIKKAMQLIEKGGITISEAAYQSGFNDLKYFRENFVKQTGETPSAYKKKIQKKQES